MCFCALGKEDRGVVQNVMPVCSSKHVSLLCVERNQEEKKEEEERKRVHG